ncbi:MAG TPA: hypothetical protein VKU19_14945 [Bryobacteraceae bacterium]|nr:hypothetical protein [Bryobacteraceae bacterium]
MMPSPSPERGRMQSPAPPENRYFLRATRGTEETEQFELARWEYLELRLLSDEIRSEFYDQMEVAVAANAMVRRANWCTGTAAAVLLSLKAAGRLAESWWDILVFVGLAVAARVLASWFGRTCTLKLLVRQLAGRNTSPGQSESP